MTHVAVQAPPRTEPSEGLARGALGLPSVLFLIVTGAAPLAAMLFNVPIAVLGGGSAAPAGFLLATITLTIFSVGYIEMSRRVTSAGGFYTFISHGFGSLLGMGTAVLIALCYVIFSAAVIGSTGYFAATTVEEFTGVVLPAYVYMGVALALISLLAWLHVELTARLLGIALVAEVLVLGAFSVAVVAQGGDSGIGLAPLNPAGLFGNDEAVATFGAGAAGVALFAAFWSWVGFEMAPNYAEESRDPRRIAAWATYGSVIGLGVLYTFVSLVFVEAWGEDNVAPAIAAQFAGEYASAFYPLTDRYAGSALTTVLQVLIVTSSFACAMAFYNTASRYLFALGREGMLPRRLARTHPTHRSPHVASMVVSAIVAAYVLAFTLYDPSTEGALLKLATWSPLLGVLGILAVQALVSFAIIRYFLREARDGFHWWKTLVAPIIGGLAQIAACYLLVANRGLLSGAEYALFIKAIPWLVLAMFVAGIVLALWIRYRDAARYRSIGRFVHQPDAGLEPEVAVAVAADR